MDNIIACGFVIRSPRNNLITRPGSESHGRRVGLMSNTFPAIYATSGEATTALVAKIRGATNPYWKAYWMKAKIVPVVIAIDSRGVGRGRRRGIWTYRRHG